jgi:solute carrier family 25 (adenine nucleotide translocator) protein 4/5/6/31
LTANLVAGGLAGCLSNSIVHPLDLSRTRIGVEIGRKASERRFRGLSDTLQTIYRQNGYRGLYQGFGISLFGIFLYRGLYFGLYDTGKTVLKGTQKLFLT